MSYYSLLLCLLICFSAAWGSLILHTYNLPPKTSNNSNVITLDFIDDNAFDMHYYSSCTDCKCFIEQTSLTSQKQTDSSFTNKIIQSCVISSRLYLLHQSDSSQFSYSIFDISPPNTLTEIAKETPLTSFNSAAVKNAFFSADSQAFIGFSTKSLLIATLDEQGQAQEDSYELSSDQDPSDSDTIYDVVYVEDLLFLAKGKDGIEMVTLKADSKPDRSALSLDDLEVNEGFEATKLAVDVGNKILFVYDCDSGQNSVIALDFSSKDELTLVNNYDFGLNQISQLLLSSDRLHIINTDRQDNETSNYFELLSTTDNGYQEPDMIKVWHIPEKAGKIQQVDDKLLIEGDEYLYLLRKDPSYEVSISELSVVIINKDEEGDFFPIVQDSTTYLLNVNSLTVSLYSVQQASVPALKCGIYKQGEYAGTVPFEVDVYRETCPDAPKNSEESVCLDHYAFDVVFTGNTVTEFDSTPLSPQPINITNWNETLSNTTWTHRAHRDHTGIGIDKPGTGDPLDIKRPDLIAPDAPYNDRIDSKVGLAIVGVIVIICFGCLVKWIVDFVRNSKDNIQGQFRHQQLEEDASGNEESHQNSDPRSSEEDVDY